MDLSTLERDGLMSNTIAAGLTAVLIFASLFGFQALATNIFVTRREFEAFQKQMLERISSLEQANKDQFNRTMQRLDVLTERSALLVGAKAVANEGRPMRELQGGEGS